MCFKLYNLLYYKGLKPLILLLINFTILLVSNQILSCFTVDAGHFSVACTDRKLVGVSFLYNHYSDIAVLVIEFMNCSTRLPISIMLILIVLNQLSSLFEISASLSLSPMTIDIGWSF